MRDIVVHGAPRVQYALLQKKLIFGNLRVKADVLDWWVG
jgi:hypothetical protein